MKKLIKGFTLIELLVVIGILAILLAITLIAINPAKQFAQSRNAKRQSDALQILNAIHSYTADTGTGGGKGALPSEITALVADTPTELSLATTLGTVCAKLVPNYIAGLPVDPSAASSAPITDCTVAGWDTLYTVSIDTSKQRVTVAATVTDPGLPLVSVTR